MHTLRMRIATLNHTSAGSWLTIYAREFANFEDFMEYKEWAVSDYNTKRPHTSLNYMTLEVFESAILNADFRKKWCGTNMLK